MLLTCWHNLSSPISPPRPRANDLVSGPSNGDLDLNGDGSFTYTPNAGYVGSDSFQYKLNNGVEDSNTATVNLAVTDNAPVADGGSFTVLHDHELDNYLSGSDDDLDSLTFSAASGPSHGSLTVTSDGSFTYTPTAGYVGSDSFTYTVNDGALTSDPATVSIDVTDNAPVANPDSYTVAKNSAATPYGSVLGNDTDADGDVLTATLGSGVSHGTLTFHSDGSFSYQPTFGYTGTDSFSYTASDGAESSEPASVSLNVVDEGTLTANPDSYSILHDSTLSVAAQGVLANDSDSDGDDLTASLSGNASNGSVTLNSDGSFTYRPHAGYVGSDSFSYTASDGDNTRDPVRVTIEVTDNAPVANGGGFSVLHDEELDGEVGGSDADGDALSFNIASQPSNGNLDFNSDGSFSYVPTSGYVGGDSFSYTVSDGALTSMPATVSIDVTDQAPTAGDLDYDLPENSTLTVSAAAGLLSAASDADGDDLTASVSSGPAYGSLSVNSDGSFTYTPDSDYSGSDSFSYTVSDGVRTSLPARVTLSIHPVDTAPTVGPAGYSVVHDRELDGEVSGSDADGDTLTFSAASAPSHGSLTVNSDGSFIYTPQTHYLGTDSFTYLASDGTLSSDPATVTIDVTDQAPVAAGDSYEVERNNDLFVDEDSGVLANDSDPDDDDLTASVMSGPSHGTLNFDGDGFDYTPDANFFGSDSFTYKANDGVLDSNTATVTLTVTASPPVAGDDSYAVLKDHALIVPAKGVLGNDSSPDNLDITADGASQPAHGSVSLNSDGSFTYTPDTDYVGTDSFTYTASDSTDLTSDPATVSINVKKNNTPPSAGDLSYSLNHDTTLNTDADSGVLSAASDADDDKLTAVLDSGPSNGTLSLSGDGSFTYTPNAGFHGTDSFTFQAFDGTDLSNVATATLTVVNDPPVANPDKYSVLASGTTTTGSVLDNDTDPENDDLTAVLVSGPSAGDLTFNSDASFTYTPNDSFTDSDSFTYEASDGVNLSTPATVTLTSGPVAADWSYTVTHDQTLSEDAADGLLNGAFDADGDSLTAGLATGPSHGTATVNSDGSFTYVPNTHFVGSDSFTYTVSDGTNTSAPATVTISVINNLPSAADASFNLLHDHTLTVPYSSGILASASDADGDSLTAQLLASPSNGTLQLSSDGGFTYTPNSHFAGTDSFTYEASDGVSTSDPATVFLQVTNAAPVAANDNYSIAPGQVLTVSSGVLANDVDPDGDSLTAQLMSGPSNGQLAFNNDGSFVYTPNAGFVGNDSFTYQASDGIAASNTATVTITVSNTVAANDDEFATGMNQPLTVATPGVLGNDVAPTGETLSTELNSGPVHGTVTLNPDGSFTYTPDTDFTGDDSFTYYASAGGFLSASPAKVTIHVVNVTLAMPNSPWVLLNANDDNGSPITNMIPQTRDYNFLRQLPANDPQLQPLNITVNNPTPGGFVDLEILPAAGATGKIRLWADQQKTRQITPGFYPVMGPGALPPTIYVEGINSTARNIANNKVEAPVLDNTIIATYAVLVPNGIGGAIPVSTSEINVGVAPVINFFTINNVPSPPNPAPKNPTAGRINWGNTGAGLPGTSPGNDINHNGYQTYGVNPGAVNPLAPILGQAAATFNAQVFNANLPGALHFVQNEWILNGGGGATNAWQLDGPMAPPTQNWVWMVNGREEPASDPILDMALEQQPPPPYYHAQGVPAIGNSVQIMSGDSPYASFDYLVDKGLGGNAPGFSVPRVAWTFKFRLYLVWSMPAGSGKAGDVIVPLAVRYWSVVFRATASVANGDADTLAATSGVFTPGDFTTTPSRLNQIVVAGPTANTAAAIR